VWEIRRRGLASAAVGTRKGDKDAVSLRCGHLREKTFKNAQNKWGNEEEKSGELPVFLQKTLGRGGVVHEG